MAINPADLYRARQNQIEEQNKSIDEKNDELSADINSILGSASSFEPAETDHLRSSTEVLVEQADNFEKAHRLLQEALEDFNG